MQAPPDSPKNTPPQADAKPARHESRARKVGRLLLFCIGVSAIGAGVALRSVYADVLDKGLGVGNELGKLGDTGAVRPVRINGEQVNVVSTMEDRTYESVLDQVETACKQRSAGLRDIVDGLSPEARAHLPADTTAEAAAGIIRKEGVGEGFVACLIRDEPTKTAEGFMARMKRFAETGNLAELGDIRYVYAQQTDGGKAHVVVAWTDGAFNVKSFIPNGKDTPGSDVPEFPRAGASTRLMTAELPGAPYGMRVYEAKSSPEAVMQEYDKGATALGWELIQMPADEPNARAYSRGGADVIVFAEIQKKRTIVSVVNMHSRQ